MNARIYKPCRTAMQSGEKKTKKWLLEFTPQGKRFIEPIMGWTGSDDMMLTEVRLNFDTEEEAIAYAKREGLSYDVLEAKENSASVIRRSYIDNFKPKMPVE